jgi:hypothetical protein
LYGALFHAIADTNRVLPKVLYKNPDSTRIGRTRCGVLCRPFRSRSFKISMYQPPRWKTAILTWLGIYPTITTAMLLLWPVIAPLPIPLKTLCVTLVVVPTMVYVVMPAMQRWFRPWLTAQPAEKK